MNDENCIFLLLFELRPYKSALNLLLFGTITDREVI